MGPQHDGVGKQRRRRGVENDVIVARTPVVKQVEHFLRRQATLPGKSKHCRKAEGSGSAASGSLRWLPLPDTRRLECRSVRTLRNCEGMMKGRLAKIGVHQQDSCALLRQKRWRNSPPSRSCFRRHRTSDDQDPGGTGGRHEAVDRFADCGRTRRRAIAAGDGRSDASAGFARAAEVLPARRRTAQPDLRNHRQGLETASSSQLPRRCEPWCPTPPIPLPKELPARVPTRPISARSRIGRGSTGSEGTWPGSTTPMLADASPATMPACCNSIAESHRGPGGFNFVLQNAYWAAPWFKVEGFCFCSSTFARNIFSVSAAARYSFL